MKKLFLVLLPFAALLIYFGCQQLPTGPEEPVNGVTLFNGGTGAVLSIDLIAGQNIVVGDVTISNDGTNLYVQYNIDEPDWCLEETHLAVASTLVGIPQTNKGNPIPGQFPYKHEELGCVNVDTYTIELSNIEGYTECGDELVIAAHAVVKNLASGTNETIEIGSGMAGVTTTVLERRAGNEVGFTVVNVPAIDAWEPGSSYPNDGPDDFGWEQWSLWDSRLNSSVFRPSGTDVADWIWESYRVNDPVAGTVLYMETKFELCEPGSATLYVATDNGFEVFLNGVSLGNHGVFGEWRDSDLYQQYVPQDGWDNVQSYTLTNLVAGTNTLRLEVANEHLDMDDSPNNLVGTGSNNPGGVIFLISGSSTCYQYETAWGYGFGFPGRNWATYIEYETSCPPECEEWIVFGSNLNGGTAPLDDAIYAYDLNAQTQTLVYDPGVISSNQNYPNANAYDPVNQRIYFGTNDGRLYYNQIGSNSHVLVASGFGTMHNAAWYNGKLYYIEGNGPTLYEVTISGGAATRADIGSVPLTGGYGDIAFDPVNPGRFIASCSAGWYWFDINGGSGTLTHSGDGDATLRQLAYGSDGTLYAVKATTGEFYTVVYDIVGGTVTHTFYWNSPYTYTDLASGPQCQ